LRELKNEEKWVGINNYEFDDVWPEDWNEHFWYDSSNSEFQEYLKKEQEKYPKMTEESLLGYLGSQGHSYGRKVLFDEEKAKKILNDFEDVKDKVENVVIYSLEGKHRPAGIGIAMNQIYGWGIKGLTKKYFGYRKFVYETMIEASQVR
jgi:hypothetical protein